MIVRPMREADINAVVRIERISFSNPWSGNAFLYELHNSYSRNYIVTFMDRGPHPSATVEPTDVDGYACLQCVADEVHLLKIAVDPNLRRRGIAGKLLDHCIAKTAGIGQSAMILEVRPSNRAAIHLYEKFGFEVIAIRPEYYILDSGEKEDALIMRKTFERRYQWQ